jgi:hypothetical protein
MVSNTSVTVILVVVGAIMLLVSVVGGYLSSLYSPEYFVVWMAVAFVGIILALVGFAVGMGGEKSEKE